MPEDPNVATPPVDEGQVAPAPEAGAEPGQAAAQAIFEYTYPDGTQDKFSSREELEKAWRDSYLRQQDYTRKTQYLSSERKKFEEQQAEFKRQMEAFQKTKSKYDRWDETLQRYPSLVQELEKRLDGPRNVDDVYTRAMGYADEKSTELAERLEKLEQQLSQQNEERELESVYAQMEQKYGPEFNREAVKEMLGYLQNGETAPLVEILHFASRGRQSPAEFQARLAAKEKEKAQASLMPAGGGTPPAGERQFNDVTEARQQAMRDAGLM